MIRNPIEQTKEKLSEQTKETLAVKPVFCIAIGRWIEQLETFERSY